MEFKDIVKKRMATRKFSNKVVNDEVLGKIVSLARLAPTAKNMQPQKIYVIKSEEGLKKIDKASPCRYNAPVVMLVCSDTSLAWKNLNDSTYEMDASIVATYLMLAATNYGVDNIWVKMFDKNIIKEEFSLDENVEPICLIPLGYKSEDCPLSPMHNVRKSLAETVKYL